MSNNDVSHTVAALDALFERWNRTDQPGLLVGVQLGDRLLYRRAFGMASLETGHANHVATAMRIGSTSKHFLALLLLLLAEEGLVDLDSPVGTYLPELQGFNAEPTLRQLLQHRGGTRCHIDLGFFGHDMVAPPEGSALALLRNHGGRNFAPGAAMMYNNGGYHLASLTAERVTGASLQMLLRRYLFDPLDMHDTHLVKSDYVITPGIASFHVRDNGQWHRGLFPSREILGEGGIVSTIGDMLKWASHLQSRDSFGKPESWNALLTVTRERDGAQGYHGLGLMKRTYRGVDTIRHSGGVAGGSSDFLCAPGEGLGIIIMCNGAIDAVPTALTDQVVDIVLGNVLDAPAPRPDPDRYLDWIGHYGSPETGMVYSLEAQNGGLCLRIANYGVASPLCLDADGGLSTGLNGNSPVRVHCEPDRPCDGSLSVTFAGQTDPCARLVGDGNTDFFATLVGQFEGAESGLEARIERCGQGLTLHVRDPWGSNAFDLAPLGGPWLSMRSRLHADEFGATLWFPNGWAGGFTLNSARTRDLQFQRLAAGTRQ